MNAATPATVRLEDYRPPPFLIPEVELDLDLVAEDDARVRAQLVVERNPAATDPDAALKLDLDELSLQSVAVDGTTLPQRTLQAIRTQAP
jgi:aminopeptidase N